MPPETAGGVSGEGRYLGIVIAKLVRSGALRRAGSPNDKSTPVLLLTVSTLPELRAELEQLGVACMAKRSASPSAVADWLAATLGIDEEDEGQAVT
jgi:hypothetical protein